jgi:Lambda phage tail tube protein, TTP
MSNPIIGISDSFEFATVASPSTFTVLVGVDSITFSGDKVSTEKTTTMSTANGVDTFIGSTQDPGSVDVKAFFLPGDTTQVALEAIRLAAQPVAMKALYGSSNSCSFSGIVESMTPSFPLEKPARLDIKIKVTGVKTYV